MNEQKVITVNRCEGCPFEKRHDMGHECCVPSLGRCVEIAPKHAFVSTPEWCPLRVSDLVVRWAP